MTMIIRIAEGVRSSKESYLGTQVAPSRRGPAAAESGTGRGDSLGWHCSQHAAWQPSALALPNWLHSAVDCASSKG